MLITSHKHPDSSHISSVYSTTRISRTRLALSRMCSFFDCGLSVGSNSGGAMLHSRGSFASHVLPRGKGKLARILKPTSNKREHHKLYRNSKKKVFSQREVSHQLKLLPLQFYIHDTTMTSFNDSHIFSGHHLNSIQFNSSPINHNSPTHFVVVHSP